MVLRHRVLSASLLVCSSAVLASSLALAQTDDERAGARAAADAGLQAFNAKNWSACKDYFTRAQSLVDAPPHLLYLARCDAQLGQLVSAREAYLKLRRESVAPDKPRAFQDAKTEGETELAALEPRIPYLNIVVTGAAGKTVAVKMDGVEVPAALVGVPRPVNPGAHKIEASADGFGAAPKAVTLGEGQHQDVTLELTPGPAGAAPAPPVKAPPSPVPAAPDATPAQDAGTAPSTPGVYPLRTVGFITMGVGVAGLVVGGVFLGISAGNSSDADNKYHQFNCSTFCTPQQQQQVKDLDNQAASAKTIGFITGAVGIAAVGAGLTMVFVPKREASAPQQGAHVEPTFGLGSLGLRGSF